MNDVLPSRPALLRAIARIERTTRVSAGPRTTAALGHAAIDEALGGGLMRGRVHEVFAAAPEDSSSASGFAAMLAHRLGGGIVWLRQREAEQRGGMLHAYGLAAIGIDPTALILALPPDPKALLRAAAEVVRCPEVGVAVIELWRSPGGLDLTASRRLALAAEASGVTALMLRIDAEAEASAAQTRWSVRAAHSAPLLGGAPGHSALDLALVRQRGRPLGGRWIVEWRCDEGVFRDTGRAPALPGAGLPAAFDRSAAHERRRA